MKNVSSSDKRRLESSELLLCKMAKLESVTILGNDEEAPACATALVGEMEVMIPMAGLIDKDAELARVNKALEKIGKDFARTEGKLSNEKFVSKAPEAVIAKEREKLEDYKGQIAKLEEQKATIESL